MHDLVEFGFIGNLGPQETPVFILSFFAHRNQAPSLLPGQNTPAPN